MAVSSDQFKKKINMKINYVADGCLFLFLSGSQIKHVAQGLIAF